MPIANPPTCPHNAIEENSAASFQLRFVRISACLPFQKLQRLPIELFDVLVNRRMRAAFKDQHFGFTNRSLQALRKASRCRRIVTAETDLRRRSDAAQMGLGIMAGHRVRLGYETGD
jgi:hypothetical protein